jgi:hypothetical protein
VHLEWEHRSTVAWPGVAIECVAFYFGMTLMPALKSQYVQAVRRMILHIHGNP